MMSIFAHAGVDIQHLCHTKARIIYRYVIMLFTGISLNPAELIFTPVSHHNDMSPYHADISG